MAADGGGERRRRALTMAALLREREAASGARLIWAGWAGGTTSPQCAPWWRGGPEGAVSDAPSHNPHPTTHLPRRAAPSAAHAGSRPASSPPFPHGPMSSVCLSSRLGPSQVTPYPGWDPSIQAGTLPPFPSPPPLAPHPRWDPFIKAGTSPSPPCAPSWDLSTCTLPKMGPAHIPPTNHTGYTPHLLPV